MREDLSFSVIAQLMILGPIHRLGYISFKLHMIDENYDLKNVIRDFSHFLIHTLIVKKAKNTKLFCLSFLTNAWKKSLLQTMVLIWLKLWMIRCKFHERLIIYIISYLNTAYQRPHKSTSFSGQFSLMIYYMKSWWNISHASSRQFNVINLGTSASSFICAISDLMLEEICKMNQLLAKNHDKTTPILLMQGQLLNQSIEAPNSQEYLSSRCMRLAAILVGGMENGTLLEAALDRYLDFLNAETDNLIGWSRERRCDVTNPSQLSSVVLRVPATSAKSDSILTSCGNIYAMSAYCTLHGHFFRDRVEYKKWIRKSMNMIEELADSNKKIPPTIISSRTMGLFHSTTVNPLPNSISFEDRMLRNQRVCGMEHKWPILSFGCYEAGMLAEPLIPTLEPMERFDNAISGVVIKMLS